MKWEQRAYEAYKNEEDRAPCRERLALYRVKVPYREDAKDR
jgi:hypothetical protein